VGAPFGSEVQRRISWVGPDGVILRLIRRVTRSRFRTRPR
jgi:hypothetical protein